MVSYLKVANFVMIIIAPAIIMMMNGVSISQRQFVENFNDKRTFTGYKKVFERDPINGGDYLIALSDSPLDDVPIPHISSNSFNFACLKLISKLQLYKLQPCYRLHI